MAWINDTPHSIHRRAADAQEKIDTREERQRTRPRKPPPTLEERAAKVAAKLASGTNIILTRSGHKDCWTYDEGDQDKAVPKTLITHLIKTGELVELEPGLIMGTPAQVWCHPSRKPQ